MRAVIDRAYKRFGVTWTRSLVRRGLCAAGETGGLFKAEPYRLICSSTSQPIYPGELRDWYTPPMTFDDLYQWTNQLGAAKKLTAAEKRRIEAELPQFIHNLNPASAPSRLRLPTGETLSNATRMTALKCQCLFLARNAFGANYVKADKAYEQLAKDVLFRVMRHAFNSSDPKGIFCCPPCTLSLLPLYATACFRWVDCDELTSNVLKALKEGTSVFARTYPKAYAQWSLSLPSRTGR